MVKSGAERSDKTTAKYDPEVIMLRIKALQNYSKRLFPKPSEQSFRLDENLEVWATEFNLPYGMRGSLYTFVKDIIWIWNELTDLDKDYLHQKWITKGLPQELWDRLPSKYSEITAIAITRNSGNISVKYETDVFPYSEEDINPEETDYVLNDEQLPEEPELYTQNYWRQETIKYHNLDYLCVWSDTKMDQSVGIDLLIETVQPLLCDKNVTINCYMTEPYQSPQNKTNAIGTSYVVESGSETKTEKTKTMTTRNVNDVLASIPSQTNINTTYVTQVT